MIFLPFLPRNFLYELVVKMVLHPKYLHTIYQKFYPDNLKIFVAEYNGQRVSGCYYLVFKNGLYLWVGIPKTGLAGISPMT